MIQFFAPDILETLTLPESDSQHCVRVLRKQEGDVIEVIDGRGTRYTCRIVEAHAKRTRLEIIGREKVDKFWRGNITIAVAPTKHIDRMEWLVEKLTEIGVDRIVPLLCQRSERKDIKQQRLEKIAVSAMKQSLKGICPEVCEMTTWPKFIQSVDSSAQLFIAHCMNEMERKLLSRELHEGSDVVIAIGPEGDFSPEEVRQATDIGFVPVSLGCAQRLPHSWPARQSMWSTNSKIKVLHHVLSTSNDLKYNMNNPDISAYLRSSSTVNFFLLAGPCVIEGEEMAFEIAEKVSEVCSRLNIPYVFKGSYRKANRSRIDSFTGIGDIKALEILRKVGKTFGIPVVTDIHTAEEAAMAAEYVDVLQIPAFLCRQTDLLVAAGRTGKMVNIKKGQFLSPEAMKYAVQKVRDAGNNHVAITERGTTFGYQDLIVDYRGIPEMKKNGCPVILDVTHSLQQPNQSAGVTGGRPDLIATVARAGIAVGADGIFIETHQRPEVAKSDGANMLALHLLPDLLEQLTTLRMAVNAIDGDK